MPMEDSKQQDLGTMDSDKRDRLSELVEELTTSGEPTLNEKKMKEVKKICRISNNYIEHLYHLIMTQLSQEHAEIRLSAFHITTELFSRSHHFRVLLVANMQDFLELTVETDSDQPLPPPKEVAQKMKRLAIQTVQSWHTTYGDAYKKLALGYHFLKHVKKVDFQDVEARTQAERRRQDERQRRLQTIYGEKIEKAKSEIQDMSADIEESLTEISNCLKLLLPDLDNFSVPSLGPEINSKSASTSENSASNNTALGTHEDTQQHSERSPVVSGQEMHKDSNPSDGETEGEPNESAGFLRNSGVMSRQYNLELHVSADMSVKESEDNEAVMNTVRDLHRLVSSKYLPTVQSWIQVFTRAGGEEQALRQALDLKASLDRALERCASLNISPDKRQRRVVRADDSGDEDDDFEEVSEKVDFEPQALDALRMKDGLQPLMASRSTPTIQKAAPKQLTIKPAPPPVHPAGRPPGTRAKRRLAEEEQDPTTAAATLRVLKQRLPISKEANRDTCGEASTSSAQPAPKAKDGDVPVVPFGIDLYYWGKEQPTAGKIIKYSSQHQFWVPHETEEEVVNEELSAQMKARHITFAGRFQPVEHKCKAPMPNGSLCERQDRFKCPFHGRIVPRDELGRPTNPEDAERLAKEKADLEAQQDWRDPELMREIEAATGEDLGSSKTFGKGKQQGTKGKGKKKKYPNLTDLKKSTNTSRSRLEKKVFNKSSVRRVTDVMNKMDKRKHEKFSNQFNYALN